MRNTDQVMLNMYLARAANDGNLADVKGYLALGANPHHDDCLPLESAMKRRRYDVMDHLIEVGRVDQANSRIAIQAMFIDDPAVRDRILPRVNRRRALLNFAQDPNITDTHSPAEALALGAEILFPYLTPRERTLWAKDPVLGTLPIIQSVKRQAQLAASSGVARARRPRA